MTTSPKSPSSSRSVIDTPRSAIETALEMFTLAGLLTMLVAVGRALPTLPARIPSHFDAAGRVNGWAGKEILWLPVGVSFFLYVLLTVIRRYPQIYNYPVRITEQNAARQYALAGSLLSWMKLELVGIMGYLSFGMIEVSQGHQAGLSPVFVFAGLGAVFGTVSIYMVKAWQAR